MNSTVNKASRQLFTRPDDELFQDWDHLIGNLRERERRVSEIQVKKISAFSNGENVMLNMVNGNGDYTRELNDWSFNNLCRTVKAPPNYINSLDPEIAAKCLDYGLQNNAFASGTVANITDKEVRGFYSNKYQRVPDVDVAEFVRDLSFKYGYEPAGKFAGIRGGLAPVRPEATGLYASDRDVFMFLAYEKEPFEVNGEAFYHLTMVWNSEVGSRTLGFLTCLYRYICGNHIVWGARDIVEFSQKHIGTSSDVLRNYSKIMEGYDKYRQQMQQISIAQINIAQRKEFADKIENAEKKLQAYMSLKDARGALEFIHDERAYPKNPMSVYGIAQGVTLYSQTMPNANYRHALDLSAGNMMVKEVGF